MSEAKVETEAKAEAGAKWAASKALIQPTCIFKHWQKAAYYVIVSVLPSIYLVYF